MHAGHHPAVYSRVAGGIDDIFAGNDDIIQFCCPKRLQDLKTNSFRLVMQGIDFIDKNFLCLALNHDTHFLKQDRCIPCNNIIHELNLGLDQQTVVGEIVSGSRFDAINGDPSFED